MHKGLTDATPSRKREGGGGCLKERVSGSVRLGVDSRNLREQGNNFSVFFSA